MEHKKQIGEQLVTWLSGEGKEQTMEDPNLSAWLAEDESHPKAFKRYQQIWEGASSYIEPETFSTQAAWNKVDRQIRHRQRTLRILWNVGYTVSGMVASLLILFALSQWGIFDRQPDSSVRLVAAYGSRSEATLPDGTVVKLNSGSDLTYTYHKASHTREVQFEGEAYFDVAKGEDPFVIQMHDDLRLTVHGTSFNLQAYPNESSVEAALVEGCIELEHANQKLRMAPGEMAAFDKQTKALKPLEGNATHAYAWLEDKLYMDNLSLAKISKYMERRYNVQITLEEGLAERYHYNGVLNEATVSDVLYVLSRMSPIQYSVKGKQIRITSKSTMPMKK